MHAFIANSNETTDVAQHLQSEWSGSLPCVPPASQAVSQQLKFDRELLSEQLAPKLVYRHFGRWNIGEHHGR